MNPITDYEIHIMRIIRWILCIPAMYYTAFTTGLILIPLGSPGKVVAILLSALAGVTVAPKHRVLVTVFAYFYGNYLYATNVNNLYAVNYSELFFGYCQMVSKQIELFAIPSVLTLVAATLMDRESKRIECERDQLRDSLTD